MSIPPPANVCGCASLDVQTCLSTILEKEHENLERDINNDDDNPHPLRFIEGYRVAMKYLSAVQIDNTLN